jgi:hypothetical protein
MKDFVEDQEDRTRGFVPPEPRGLGVRWIVLGVVAVLALVFVLAKVLPSAAGGSNAAGTPLAHRVK